MLTLTTGANSGKYFRYLKQNLTNVINVSNNKNIPIRIIVYNLGMNQAEIKEIQSFQYVILENFEFSKYPEHVSLKKYYGRNCTYAWKPIIVYDVCEKYGGMVHWMDTRNLYTDFTNLIEILKTEYLYSPLTSGNIKKWTHKTCLKYMNGYKYKTYRNRNAAVVGINYDIDWVKKFIKEWKDLALVKECICPEGSSRRNHRQDQAVLTILYYKYQDRYKFKNICEKIDLSTHNELIT